MIDVEQWVKEIQEEQSRGYVVACIIKLLIKRTNMTDEEATAFLEAVKGGWY